MHLLNFKQNTQQVSCVILLPAVQADEAVSQAGHEVLVVVPRPQHEIAIDSENPKGVQQSNLLSYCLVRPTELVEDGPVQTVVDGVEGKALGAPLRLEKTRIQVRGKRFVPRWSFSCDYTAVLFELL